MKRKAGAAITDEEREKICERIFDLMSNGESVLHACKRKNTCSRETFYKWLREYPELQARYQIAMDARAEKMFEELDDIAHDGRNDWMKNRFGEDVVNNEAVQRSRLRIDTIKYKLGVMSPKRYGNRQQVALTDAEGKTVTPTLMLSLQGTNSEVERLEHSDG